MDSCNAVLVGWKKGESGLSWSGSLMKSSTKKAANSTQIDRIRSRLHTLLEWAARKRLIASAAAGLKLERP